MSSGFCHSLNEICDLLGFYAPENISFLPTFQDNLSGPSSRVKQSKKKYLTLEDETYKLSRNVNKKLPFYTASNTKECRSKI
jgi:hypothetical protein